MSDDLNLDDDYGIIDVVRDTLNTRQRTFCIEYAACGNATKAALRAGYSRSCAQMHGSRLLADEKIKAYVEDLLQGRAQKAFVDATVVIEELMALAKSDISTAFDENGNLKPFDEWPAAARAAVSSIETEELFEWEGDGANRKKVFTGYARKIKLWDKNKAIEMLGKHLKLFTDNVNLNVSAVRIVDTLGDESDVGE